MKVVDQYSDPALGTLFRQLRVMPTLEEFVKEASIESAEADGLPDSAFAWPDQRKFPLHNDKHAALSYAYAQSASGVPAAVMTRIKEALEVYSVPEDVFKTVKVAAVEEPADAYLLPDLKLMPVKTAEDVKFAERKLHEQLPKLDLEHRALAFGNLVKKADAHGVQLHPGSLKIAGLVVSSMRQTRQWLEARAAATGNDMYKQAFQTLSDALAKHPEESRDRDGLLKLASVIAEIDKKAGLDKHYDRKLPDPLQTVFNTEKEAAATVDLGGKMVPLSKLAALPASFWEDLGGTELSNEIAPGGVVDASKLSEVVETLPMDLKSILKSQLRM
jgi:hypothetical protein